MKNYLLIILLLCAGAYNGYGQKKQPSDYHLQKAIDLMQNNGDEKEVMECLDQQLQETPDNADARVVRATLYLKQKKYGNALSDMNLAIKYYKKVGYSLNTLYTGDVPAHITIWKISTKHLPTMIPLTN